MAPDKIATLNWILFDNHNANGIIYLKIWCLNVDWIMLNVKFIEDHSSFIWTFSNMLGCMLCHAIVFSTDSP